MRMMLTVQMPVDAANAAIKDGRLGKVLEAAMERLKPEAAYFTTIQGDRGGIFVFDLRDPSDIPSICEPFFSELEASVELSPVMNIESLRTGLAKAFAT
jgi:hypothetical protein